MNNRRFFAMTALAFAAQVVAQYSPPAAIFPALMLLILGFDAIVEKIHAN